MSYLTLYNRITLTSRGKLKLFSIEVMRLTLLSIQMSPPGSFLGARFEFLQAQKRMYAASIISNSKAACIADIQRRYFKRFPIEHQHNVDPMPEFLASVDDDEADTEFVAPDSNSMSPEEFKKAEGVFQERQKLVTFRKQVSRLNLGYL